MPGVDWIRFGMFSDEGDIALNRVYRLIEAEIRMDQVSQETLPDRIRLGLKYVAYQADAKGHPEVYDTAVQEALEDHIHRLCLKQGWPRINRWDW